MPSFQPTYTHMGTPSRLATIGGYLSLSLFVTLTYLSAPDSYTISIYSTVPVAAWGCYLLAGIIGIWLLFYTDSVHGSSLVGGPMATISLMPLLQGYYVMGKGDPLTHIGYSIDIMAGALSPFDLMYPLTHLLAISIHKITGAEINRAFGLVVAVFTIVFFFGIVLSVRELAKNTPHLTPRDAVSCASISAALFLPLNHIGMYLIPHPTSQGVFWFAFLAYLLIRDIAVGSRRSQMLFLIAGFVTIFIHPQHAVMLGGLIIGIAITWWLSDHAFKPIQTTRVAWYGVFIFAAIFVWALDKAVFLRALSSYILQFLTTPDTGGPSRTETTTMSLLDIGGSYLEIYAVLFFIPTLFVSLSITCVLWALYREWVGESTTATRLIIAFSGGLFPICVFTVTLIPIRPNAVPFRFVGLLFVFGTLFGAFILAYSVTQGAISSTRVTRGFVAVFLTVCLVASLVAIFPSPFIYRESGHVTNAEIASHETLSGVQSSGMEYYNVRTHSSRQFQAIYGVEGTQQRGLLIGNRPTGVNDMPNHFNKQSMETVSEGDYYLYITERDRRMETELYLGFQFNKDDFQYLESNNNTIRYYDSRGVQGYRFSNS